MSASVAPVPSAARWRRLLTSHGIHYLVLALAGIFLLIASTRSWFFFDDWALLVPSQENIWAPHVGHWSTTPWVVFLALRNVFGLNSYVPFAIPVIIAQLGFAHLIWRFCIRVGMIPWIATVLSILIMFFGAGSENILWAFQVGFMGAMALGMVVVLLLMKDRLGARDTVLIVVLSIVALSCSGTAIPVLLVAALIGWSRHGFWRIAGLLALPAIAYLVWFAIIGHTAAPNGRASGIADLFYRVPKFAISMLTDGLGRALPIAALGGVLFAAVAIWGVLTYGRATQTARPAYVLFLAAPIFALVTAYSRVDLGLATATSSRYLFFAISMMLPLAGVALSATVARAHLPLAPVVLILLVVVVYNAGGVAGTLIVRDSRSAEARENLSAYAAVESQYPGAVPSARPGGEWAPDVELSDLATFVRNGWFTPGKYTEADELSARANLGLAARDAVAPATQSGCTSLSADGTASTIEGAEVLVHASSATSVTTSLAEGGSTGDARGFDIPAGWTTIQLGGSVPFGVHLVISTRSGGVDACPAN